MYWLKLKRWKVSICLPPAPVFSMQCTIDVDVSCYIGLVEYIHLSMRCRGTNKLVSRDNASLKNELITKRNLIKPRQTVVYCNTVFNSLRQHSTTATLHYPPSISHTPLPTSYLLTYAPPAPSIWPEMPKEVSLPMALKALQVKSNYIEISWKDNNNQELHRNYTIGVTDDVCEIFHA